jgi:hypothetical protein
LPTGSRWPPMGGYKNQEDTIHHGRCLPEGLWQRTRPRRSRESVMASPTRKSTAGDLPG